MPILRIGRETEFRLLALPESGMGFQIVQYRNQPWIIFNATVTLPLSELRETTFSEEDYSLISGNPESQSILALDEIDFRQEFSIVFSALDPSLRNSSLGLSFCESPISPPTYVISQKWPYSYYRFCSYWADKRVDTNGNFLPGTYATTYNDLHFVPSGFAAVGRYALPNPASAPFVFSILTFNRPTLMGTATPNFGQAGGGVEVLFKAGASNQPGVSFMINVG
jgi:hypothetical protein